MVKVPKIYVLALNVYPWPIVRVFNESKVIVGHQQNVDMGVVKT